VIKPPVALKAQRVILRNRSASSPDFSSV